MGLKNFTKPGSKQVRLTKGGKKFTNDELKPNRKYAVKGEDTQSVKGNK